jgi:N-acetylglucosaminyl-diphospho-decaprenol L-rhamnosyltransferase
MMKVPPIIGLTLNFRDAVRTQRCIDSLLSNGAEHVVVWDNSDDEGFSARNLAKQWLENDEITLLVSPANLGFAAAVNRGIDWIKVHFGEVWVALINNDAEFLPGSLGLLSEALVDRPEVILACPDIDNGGRITGPTYYQRLFGILSSKKMPGSAPHASGCAMLIAVNRIKQPLFDESFFMYGEDAELGWRMARSGKAFTHVQHVLVRHDGSASSGMGSEFYESRMIAAHILLARKLATSKWDYVALLLGRLIVLPSRAIVRAWRYRSARPLRALILGWRLANGDDLLLMRAQVVESAQAHGFLSCASNALKNKSSQAT